MGLDPSHQCDQLLVIGEPHRHFDRIVSLVVAFYVVNMMIVQSCRFGNLLALQNAFHDLRLVGGGGADFMNAAAVGQQLCLLLFPPLDIAFDRP